MLLMLDAVIAITFGTLDTGTCNYSTMTFLTARLSTVLPVVAVVLGIAGFQNTVVDGFVIPNVQQSKTLHINTRTINRWNHIPSLRHISSTINPMDLMAVSDAMATTTSSALSTTTSTSTMDPLLTYLIQTLITNGVPALFSIIVFGFIAWQIRSVMTNSRNSRNNDNMNNISTLSLLYDDLYGDQDQDPFKRNNPSSFGMFGGGNRQRFPMELPKNTGVPKLQYIKVTHLNPKYDSYKYSMTSQTQSKAIAAAQYRQSAWQRAWGKALLVSGDSSDSTSSVVLTPFQIQSLIQLEQEFLKSATEKQQEIQSIVTALQRKNIDESMKKMGMESVYQMDPNVPSTDSNTTTTSNSTVAKMIPSGGSLRKWKGNRDTNVPSTAMLSVLQTDLVNLEMKFINNVIKTVGPSYAATIRTIVLGSENGEGLTQLLLSSNLERPLTRLLAGHMNSDDTTTTDSVTQPTKKNIYVTRFPGDLNASQVATLREEITAILQSKPRPNIDEVILVLQTGGGTVTGYGLAAAQLQRIKNANIHLTIAVEQVAASGGYMMACIADTIVASPFAVLGSIGVISDIPNVYERLKEEGIEFQTITAGK